MRSVKATLEKVTNSVREENSASQPARTHFSKLESCEKLLFIAILRRPLSDPVTKMRAEKTGSSRQYGFSSRDTRDGREQKVAKCHFLTQNVGENPDKLGGKQLIR